MNEENTIDRIRRLETQLINSRYGNETINRDDAMFLVGDLIQCRNHIAMFETMPLPFPPKVEEPKRDINVGFNG